MGGGVCGVLCCACVYTYNLDNINVQLRVQQITQSLCFDHYLKTDTLYNFEMIQTRPITCNIKHEKNA